MKKLNLYTLVIIIATAFLSTSCSKDDKKDTPQPVQQEDPMAYMTIDFLETNIVGVWVSDSAYNTGTNGYYNEAYVDTMWFTTTQYSNNGVNYDNYIIDANDNRIYLNLTYLGLLEFMNQSGSQMNFVLPAAQNLPGFDKRMVRYFKQ